MLDIIIVTYNAKDKLSRCLKSIEKHTKKTDYLLTIVNNNSTDGTFQFLEKYRKQKNAKVINTHKNLGFCGGANLALRNTHNKFICLLDDDIEVTKGWLPGLMEQIKNKPKVGIVGPKISFPNKIIWSAENQLKPIRMIGSDEIDNGQRNYIRECDSLSGPCWLIRRKLINKVGWFDERFFPSQYEDVDYCLRTRLAGYKIIYDGKVEIVHHHLFRDKCRSDKNLKKFVKKWKIILDKLPLKDSHPADKHIAYGIDYLEKKKYNLALTELKKAELIDRNFSDPLYRGVVLYKLKKFDEATFEFKKVLRQNPSNSIAHYNLALVYEEVGSINKSRAEYRNSLKSLNSDSKRMMGMRMHK